MSLTVVGMYSGGAGSHAAAKRMAAYGTNALILLFADTMMEDEDLYRFLPEGVALVGGRFVRVADGRNPWEVFRDERILSSRFDPCSKALKRKLCDKWVRENCDPADTVLFGGIDWTEMHRYDREPGTRGPRDRGGMKQRRAAEGWRYEAPMCEAPYVSKDEMLAEMRADGIEPPRLYAMGFAHNNCGGFCIKAGQGHFANLLRVMPERYAFHEEQEQLLRAELGEGAYILRDRTDGGSRPLTLRDLRLRIEAKGEVDMFDIGGCGCFLEDDE